MIRKRREYNLNPLDVNKNIYIGVSLPFNGRSVFNFTRTTSLQIKSNIINLLLTNQGERVFNPDFGADISSFIFNQITEASELKDIISDKLNRYISNIVVKSVDINQTDEQEITVRINYSVNNNEDTVQIGFN